MEHFFAHEFGGLVAVLTRSLGVRRLALVEDVDSDQPTGITSHQTNALDWSENVRR